MIDLKAPSFQAARIALWSAWIVPVTLVAFSHRSALQVAALLAISLAPAGIVAALPARAFKIACLLSGLALPFTLWWCGFASMDHAGPGLEAVEAVGGVTLAQGMEVAGSVFFQPAFVIVAAAHAVLLFLACRLAFGARSAVPSTPAKSGRQLVLLLSILPLSAAAVLDRDNFHDHKTPIFGPGTLSSPLGSATSILVEKARLVLWNRELGYRRNRAASATHITAPILAMLVIGESARAETYGPAQASRGPASKALDDRIKQGLGSWLPATCASSDGTHLSVPLLLTALGPAQRAAMPTSPTVLGILKASGFATAWLANNEAGMDAREAGHDLYAGPWGGSVNPDPGQIYGTTEGGQWRLDEDMLPIARNFIGRADKPLGLILHTFGNHIAYEQRYPKDAFPAAPAGLSSEALEDLHYARAAEYGAQTILKLAAILDATSTPAFLVYTSDHGENLHSDHNGFTMHLGPRTTVEDEMVPSFVLWNAAMAAQRDPGHAVSKLTTAKMIAHADVAKLFLVLSGVTRGPVEPTVDPETWGRIEVGDEYSAVRCSAVKP